MALTSRELVRAEISALFDSITELQENLAYPPLALQGKSPVLSLHSDGTIPKMVSASVNEFDHYFIATIYINREAHGTESGETLLDQIYTKVLQEVRDQVTGTNYATLVGGSRPECARLCDD